MGASDARHGRLYLEPEPEVGPHPGYRGLLTIDALGVHVGLNCEYLYVDPGDRSNWPLADWEPVERELLVPWARVHLIEWGEDGDE